MVRFDSVRLAIVSRVGYQVATQVAPGEPFAPVGDRFFDKATPMPETGQETPMSVQAPSSTLSSAVESSTRRRWSEHNAPAAGFSTSIAQSSGRTGPRSCPLPNYQTLCVFPPESNTIPFHLLDNSRQRISIHRHSGTELFGFRSRRHAQVLSQDRFLAATRRGSRAVYRCDKYTRECASM